MTNSRIMKQLRHCHSERSEAATQRTKCARPGFQSLVLLVEAGAKRKKSEMIRSAQHDRHMVAENHEWGNALLVSLASWALSFLRASTFGFRHFAAAERPRHMCSITLSPNCEHF